MVSTRTTQADDRIYIQPDMEISDVGKGAEIEDEKQSLCQRIEEGGDVDVSGWLKRHKQTLITAGIIYGAYRILSR